MYEDLKKQYQFYENEFGILFNMDNMEFMKNISDKYFELSICDIPYGLNIDGQKENVCNNPKHNRKKHEFKKWDNKIPDKEYFNELNRISKNQIIFGANYCCKFLNHHKGWIIWDKGQRGLTMSDCELLYSSFDYPTRIFTENRNFLNIENSIHPTQKSIGIYKYLLQSYAKPNDKIFDSHVGSASSFIACMELGFNFCGCELDIDYFNESIKRIRLHEAKIKGKFYLPEEKSLFNT
jgi:site-specific DNA-methyltransferase (adenine-specific)